MSKPSVSPEASPSRLAYLDALRGVAVMMVVLVHVGVELLPYGQKSPAPVLLLTEYGQMGVQLFFVVSAFSLCVAHEKRASDPHRLRAFFILRFFRIAPLYYVGIVAALLLGMLQNADLGVRPLVPAAYTAKGVLSNVLFVHGFVISANNNVVRGGWSIGTEMAFYVCFPFLFLLSARAARQGLRSLVVMGVGFLTATLVLYYGLTDGFLIAVVNGRFLYYHLANQLPVFIAGLAAYFARRDGLWRPAKSWSLAGFAVLTAAAMTLARSGLPYAFVLLPAVSGLSFVLLLETFAQSPALCPGWLQRLGRISYSIYLFHSAAAYLLVRHLFAAPGWNDWPVARLALAFGATVSATALVAVASERWIERPGISLGRRLAGRPAPAG
jgi:peptidoglycan/LPS O-acetylase OafA/YrhL